MTPTVALSLGYALRGETGDPATGSQIFIQATDPGVASPYIWFQTDPQSGLVIDILKG